MKNELLKMLVDYVFRLLFMIAGAADISLAIRWFESRNYFLFGLFVLLAIYMLLYIIKAVFMDIFAQ